MLRGEGHGGRRTSRGEARGGQLAEWVWVGSSACWGGRRRWSVVQLQVHLVSSSRMTCCSTGRTSSLVETFPRATGGSTYPATSSGLSSPSSSIGASASSFAGCPSFASLSPVLAFFAAPDLNGVRSEVRRPLKRDWVGNEVRTRGGAATTSTHGSVWGFGGGGGGRACVRREGAGLPVVLVRAPVVHAGRGGRWSRSRVEVDLRLEFASSNLRLLSSPVTSNLLNGSVLDAGKLILRILYGSTKQIEPAQRRTKGHLY